MSSVEQAPPPPVDNPASSAPPAPAAGTAAAARDPKARAGTNPQQLPPYAVILHNDDLNTMLFVIETLGVVFGYAHAKAWDLMVEAHNRGRAVVWSGVKEHAEFKADQVRSRGADPPMRERGATPLRVSIEPLPC
jgi:ATP-dependent Clp protease adaptor protein ClpS